MAAAANQNSSSTLAEPTMQLVEADISEEEIVIFY
jgi:hypothetical protein